MLMCQGARDALSKSAISNRHSSNPHSAIRSLQFFLAPARRFVRADAEQRLGDDLVRQHGIGRVEPPEPRVAEQLFEPALLEDAESAGHLEREIHNPPGV